MLSLSAVIAATGFRCLSYPSSIPGFRGGTGSNPPADMGLQRRILNAPIQQPLIAPYSCIACAVYRLQLGVNRHTGGVYLEISF